MEVLKRSPAQDAAAALKTVASGKPARAKPVPDRRQAALLPPGRRKKEAAIAGPVAAKGRTTAG